MGRKVTKQIIRNNLESYVAFVEHASKIGAVIDGDPMDASSFAVGAQAMAYYVMALIDGEVGVENDMAKLVDIVVQVSLNDYLERGGDLDDEDDEDGPSWVDEILSRIAKAHHEGGANDGADAE